MQCPACQHQNLPSGNHCTKCGTRLPFYCDQCGAPATRGRGFCSKCANSLTDSPTPATSEAEPSVPIPTATTAPAITSTGDEVECRKCGTMNNRRLISCNSCGTPLGFVPSRTSHPSGQDAPVTVGPETPLSAAGGMPSPADPKPPAVNFEPPALLTKLTLAGLAFIAFIHLANTIRLIYGYDLLGRAQGGRLSIESILSRAQTFESSGEIVRIAVFVVYPATGLLFLVWLYRTSKQTQQLDVGRTVVTPGSAVGVWFLPEFNLFAPYIVLQDLAQRLTAFSTWTRREAFLAVWWGSIWLAVAIMVLRPKASETIDTWQESTLYLIAVQLLVALAAICAAVIVLRITGGSKAHAAAVLAAWREAKEAEAAEQAVSQRLEPSS